MEINNSKLEEALLFAAKKHRGQKRKGNGLPYIMHPIGVASILLEVKETKNINLLLAVSLLHDVCEDCGVTSKKIAKKFGFSIATLVEELTLDKEKYETIGKTKYLCQEMLKMSSYALCIKLCDRLYNVRDMKKMPESFIKKYKSETEEILLSLKHRKLTNTHKNLINLLKKELNKF